MASGTMVSLSEYLATVYEPDREYLDGKLVERNMGELEHAGLQMALAAWLSIAGGNGRFRSSRSAGCK